MISISTNILWKMSLHLRHYKSYVKFLLFFKSNMPSKNVRMLKNIGNNNCRNSCKDILLKSHPSSEYTNKNSHVPRLRHLFEYTLEYFYSSRELMRLFPYGSSLRVTSPFERCMSLYPQFIYLVRL